MALYQGPIVDAHHHFWEPELGRQPWLLPEAAIAFRYGSYESIKRTYLPPQLREDAAGLNLVGTVTMETEWDLDDPIGEMDYTEDIARRYGLPTAAIAHAVLRDPAIEAVLEELGGRPFVRGVRNKPGQAASPALAASEPTLMEDPQWRRGFALLDTYGLDFELQVAWWHMHEASRLAADFPETQITINHTGLPSDRSPEGLRGWAEALRLMARHENVLIKISGIGLPGVPWSAENNREVVQTTADIFGPDRIMFASNFPVDSLVGGYHEIFTGFAEIARGWSADEQRAAFIDNAIRAYRLPADLGA
ncbi:thioesterase [Mycetocola tolaasinivorans]|uniref:Thioesterase n=1 Tax=Mycetocola tolaasinivorans TaxID=76635 RepID=A0A3L7AAE8_9MICO|nr:amidohydrolase family protein [Mycetocola tolaasinivorans]RLP77359.1 thioesterase [Mycetocola tolaasinivorans]